MTTPIRIPAMTSNRPTSGGSTRRFDKQAGVSLVELMVSMAIGLFLMGAVALVYVNTSATSRASSLESEMNENASIALEMLQRQIGMTGYTEVDATGKRHFTGIFVRGCDGGFKAGVTDESFTGLECASSTSGSDAIAIRYQATKLNSQVVKGDASASPPTTDAPANCNYEGIKDWSYATGATSGTQYAFGYDRYYIGTDADGSKALFCKGLTGAGTYGAATALIPNIEDLQINYALTLAPVVALVIPHQVTGYATASAAVLTNATTPANLTGWARVAGVEICLIARSSQRISNFDSTSKSDFGTYVDCSNTSAVNTDGHLRRAFRTTVFLRNVRPGVPTAYKSGVDPWAQLLTVTP